MWLTVTDSIIIYIVLSLQTSPNKEELGYADSVFVDELGDTSVVIFRLEAQESKVATIVVRGSTDNYMDDIERAIDDGINTFKGLSKVLNLYNFYQYSLFIRWSNDLCDLVYQKLNACGKTVCYMISVQRAICLANSLLCRKV